MSKPLQTHHDARLGDPEVGRVAYFTLQLAGCLLIQHAETRSSILQVEFTLQELPERLQLTDDIGCFISRSGDLARKKVEAVAIRAVLDPSQPVRPGVSLFNAVRLHFHLKGVTQEQGAQLIEAFKRS
jgi:hypothetical protein